MPKKSTREKKTYGKVTDKMESSSFGRYAFQGSVQENDGGGVSVERSLGIEVVSDDQTRPGRKMSKDDDREYIVK